MTLDYSLIWKYFKIFLCPLFLLMAPQCCVLASVTSHFQRMNIVQKKEFEILFKRGCCLCE